jgi:chromate transporter
VWGILELMKSDWLEVLLLALKLGFTAFGGPAAHIAMLRDEVVTRRAWISNERFLDLLGAVNLIPGPNSTELVLHVGLERAGWRGWLAAGLGFILPAASITLGFAWAYSSYGTKPEFAGVLYGVKPVVIAVVLQAIWGLSSIALKNWTLRVIAVLTFALALLGVNELPLLLAGALLMVGLERFKVTRVTPPAMLAIPILASIPVTLPGLFWSMLKIGSVLYGSGYVLLAFLRGEFVDRLHWLTSEQLIDAIAIGQITPGPVFSSATFVGFLIAGVPGAILATVAIFAPAFAFTALTHNLISRIRQSKLASAFLDGVNASALALMLAVTLELSRTAIFDIWTAALTVISGFLLVRYKLNSSYLMLAGVALGLILKH